MDFGKGAGMEFSNRKGREREFDAGIPGNCGEREFSLTPDSVIHMASIVFHDAKKHTFSESVSSGDNHDKDKDLQNITL